MELWQTLLLNLAMLAAAMFALWAVSSRLRDVSIVDIFWGLGFVATAWISLVVADDPSWRAVILAAFVTIWGVRLSLYLAWRNWGKGEDSRYAAMRRRRGASFPIVSLVTVFGLQGLLIWVIALPLQVAPNMATAWGPAAVVGAALWGVGLAFETIGDWQLARFKADPANRGRVMNRGLWRYTRHPNYFGDFLVWWGFYLIAAEPSHAWWTVVSPVLMTVLLTRVSGASLLERSLHGRIEGYAEYTRTTSAFLPRPPRRGAP